MFVCLSKAHLCPEMHIIRCMLSFEKYHEVSTKSKPKPPYCDLDITPKAHRCLQLRSRFISINS